MYELVIVYVYTSHVLFPPYIFEKRRCIKYLYVSHSALFDLYMYTKMLANITFVCLNNMLKRKQKIRIHVTCSRAKILPLHNLIPPPWSRIPNYGILMVKACIMSFTNPSTTTVRTLPFYPLLDLIQGCASHLGLSTWMIIWPHETTEGTSCVE